MKSIFQLKNIKLSFKLIFVIMVLLGISFLMAFLPGALLSKVSLVDPHPTWEVLNPISTVFVLDSIPTTTGSLAAGNSTVPDEWLVDPAIDTLLLMMQARNIYFHKNAFYPEGIVGSNDIVVLKGNFQWDSRNTTSTDRIKGVVWQILNHPDGFNGEIIICDNTQNFGTGINHNDNNSEDPEQSIIDVVNTFVSKGYPVSYRDWADVWSVVAQEYSAGDYNDGFVFESDSKISYPKFTSPSGNYNISLKYGIWDSTSLTYNLDRLCIIDFPVLKAHSWAGATIAVKNWVGVITTAYPDERYGGFNPMHNYYFFGSYALVAKVMGVTFPKLTIVDAAWTSASGPNNFNYTVHTKVLLGSTDPCAVSWYSAKYILTPVAVEPFTTDPDREGSNYRNNLQFWTNCLRDSGFSCTMDSSEISVYDRNCISQSSMVLSLTNGWNILSVPLLAPDMTAATLFPTAVSPFYQYSIGYNQVDILENGKGYWAKFNGNQSTTIMGTYVSSNETSVNQGWNLVGPFAFYIPVNNITTIPPNIIVSPFYGYEIGYMESDTLKSGNGYWVKTNASGIIHLNTN